MKKRRPPSITLPAPEALPGDTVWVANYRRGGAREQGFLEGVTGTIRPRHRDAGVAPVYWSYRVALFRRSQRGNLIFLTVGSDDVEFIKQ